MLRQIKGEAHTGRDDDDGQKDNDPDAYPDAHLHILDEQSTPSLSKEGYWRD